MKLSWSRRALYGICIAFGLMTTSALAIDTKSSTADHTQFKELTGPFASGPEVTQACLSCHTESAKQLQATLHWNWEYAHPETGQVLGKRHVVNSFCGSVKSNEPRCTSCHIGFGWEDMKQAPPKAENRVDCLVCHDTTGEYWKVPTDAGHPLYEAIEQPLGSGIWKQPPELSNIAQHVGATQRQNCGACHFSGGGADGVKHGDLDSSLVNPARSLDVHMAKEGANFTCSSCHTTSAHNVTGSRYSTNARDTLGIDTPGHTDHTRASCESCHDLQPHKKTPKLNDHVDRVACQTCHIPEFARGGIATKTWWDWSTAGQLDENGKPFALLDKDGNPDYLSIKGDFKHGTNVKPEYRWFDGEVRYTLEDEKLDVDNPPIQVNKIAGSYQDSKARIWPFKIMRGKQPYDTKYETLLVTHVYSPDDDSALWSNYDWAKALKAGTDAAEQPYSGNFDFIETEMYWPIAHMVAPAEDALHCGECHARAGRLDAVAGFYLPGRDYNDWLDKLGWAAVLLVLLGSLVHAGLRIATRHKRSES